MSDKGAKPEHGAKQPRAKKVKADPAKVEAAQAAADQVAVDPDYIPRFKKRYNEVIRPAMMKEFGYTNVLQVPRINKIVLNIGAGEGASFGLFTDKAGADESIELAAEFVRDHLSKLLVAKPEIIEGPVVAHD